MKYRNVYFDEENHSNMSKGHIILSRKASTQVKNKFDMKLAELHMR